MAETTGKPNADEPKESGGGGTATKEPKPKAKAKPAGTKPRPKQLPPYNVILLDDNDHSFAYVIEMLQVVLAHEPEMGMKLAKEVDEAGRAIVLTTHKELAELRQEQIHAYGRDVRVATCVGSMTAIIEPAQG